MIPLRGFEGCQQRMAELLGRLGDDYFPATPRTANNAPPSMAGQVGGKPELPKPGTSPSTGTEATKSGMHIFDEHLDKAAALKPLDPMGPGAVIAKESGTDVTQLKSLAATMAQRHGIDPFVFQALIQTESDFNPHLVSGVGASGLAQLMPKTAESLGVTDIFDPTQNLEAGAKYFSQLMKQFGGDPKLALAAYNAGPGAVTRANGIPPFQETQDYVKKVLARADDMRSR